MPVNAIGKQPITIAAKLFTCWVISLLLSACGGSGGSGGDSSSTSSANSQVSVSSSVASSSASTVSSSAASSMSGVYAWWHDNAEANALTPVAANHVRQSTFYSVNVALDADSAEQHDAFVYMAIPRSGMSKQGYSNDDGAEFADAANATMSWSSFLYDADVWVQIELVNGQTIYSLDELVIRPTTLHFEKEIVSETSVRIKVPYSEKGVRFSVEFMSDLMTARSDQEGVSGHLTESVLAAEVHTEPRNALLIFAEPILTAEQEAGWVPSATSGSIYYPPEGTINLNSVTQSIVYFRPGTYVMPANYHAYLPSNVRWVYLAPGAYVKGAFEFTGNNSQYKVTGYGVISGEQYVYAADKDSANGHVPYTHLSSSKSNCDGTCLKLLQFFSNDAEQQLVVQGITLNAPPFNSFVVYGDTDSFQTDISNYKQVGSWYYQTDGVELYKNGSLSDSFFHANDDVIKLYHSNITARDVVVWKGENGPVLQFGWASRNISQIRAENIDVIHNRMYWKDQKSNTCLINSTDLYSDTPIEQDKISLSNSVSDLDIINFRSEGKSHCAMRLMALSNWNNIHINGLDIEAWNDLDTHSQLSLFKARATDDEPPQTVVLGEGAAGLNIENYRVAGQVITKGDDSWRSNSTGRLYFDESLWDNWVATADSNSDCTAQTIDFSLPELIPINTSITLTASASSDLPVYFLKKAGSANISEDQLTAGEWPGVITIAAISGNDMVCATSIVRTIRSYDPSEPPSDGRWIGASWQNWSPSAIPMSWDETEHVFIASVTLGVGTREFKITNTSDWSGDDWGGINAFSGTAIKTTGGGANIVLNVVNAGTYEIRFNPYTLEYSVSQL